jgi:hypothetical protein
MPVLDLKVNKVQVVVTVRLTIDLNNIVNHLYDFFYSNDLTGMPGLVGEKG